MKARIPRCTTHFHACDCREAAHAEQIQRLTAERDEALSQTIVAQREFIACGEACGMLPHETILGSVLRVVKERDELRNEHVLEAASESGGKWLGENVKECPDCGSPRISRHYTNGSYRGRKCTPCSKPL